MNSLLKIISEEKKQSENSYFKNVTVAPMLSL